jgi:hypothetical protein
MAFGNDKKHPILPDRVLFTALLYNSGKMRQYFLCTTKGGIP